MLTNGTKTMQTREEAQNRGHTEEQGSTRERRV